MMKIKESLRNAFRRTNSIKFIVMLIFLTISFLVFPSNSVSATTNNINPTGLTSFLDKTALWVGLSEEQQTIFSQTDNIFYDPTECDEQIGGGTAGMLPGKDNLEKIWNYLVSLNEPGVSNDAKVISGILGNLQQESDFNPFSSNGTYYGVYQTDRSEMINRVNSEVGNYWGQKMEGEKNDKALQIELEDMTQKNTRWKQFVKDLSKVQNKTPTSYMELFMLHLERCVNGSYSMTDPGVIQAMHNLYGGGSYQYQDGDKRAKYAEEIYKKYGNGGVSASTSTSTSSSTSSTVSTNNIISETAAKLAWPTKGEHAKNDPKPEYKQALEETGVTAGTQCSPSSLGADCGAFVGAVIYVSKYDKDFPSVGSSTQLAYMAEHPEKYEELKDWKKSDLKSGDIQAHNGHIRIVMEDGKKLAHASQCDRTGEITDYYEDTKFRTFRPIGATSTTTDECSPTEGGTGDINQAAIDLAWPKEEAGKHGEHDPKPAYKDALKKYFNTDYGASCSRFVETVVRYSGYDKNFGEIDLPDKGWAYTEGFYMEAHPELWEEVTNGYGKDTMQPGDIQVVKGNGWNNKSRPSGGNHIRIVIKDTDGKFRIAEAAQGKYNGEIKNYEYKGKLSSNWRVFRAKGTTSSTTSTNGGANGLTGSSLIGQTAIKLAWPTNKCTTDPTPEYAKALAETKIGKGSDDHCVVKGASCDRFVGITVRYSGVDKKFGYWIDTGNDERYITVHMERHPEQWQEVTQGYSKENAQDGDILVCDGDGCSGHTLILAKTADGKLKKVEASHTNCCVGRVTGEFKKLGNGYRAWRAKNNPAYNQNCACQVNQQNQQNGIADGGYNSEEEADKAIMNPYKNMGDGVKKYGVVPQDCAGGITSNCSAFSTYFVNRYFKTGAVQQMGYATVDHLISKGWKDGGHTPAVYAVFSQHSTSGCGCTRGGHRASMDSSNHTGVVLGINQAEDKILIGQAGCSASFEATGTYTCSLKCFSKAPYKYAHPPGPPKGI